MPAKEELVTNCIRCLAADMVQKANSGHPGTPMGMAPIANILFTEILKYNSKDSHWFNRDRFVLSNGHACVLQYCLLHLAGYKLSLEDLKNFRQLDSLTPGHPERGHTDGIEVTTGPLGQGIANGVGLAIAEAQLAGTFNKPGFEDLIDHYTYVFCGDGCLMEGVALEALSLAGHLALDKFVLVYDDNKISIDGDVSITFSEKTREKYEAMNFHVITVANGDSDYEAMRQAFAESKAVQGKPKLIILQTTIGFGSKAQGTEKVHGAPLGAEDIKNLKIKFGRNPEASFLVEEPVLQVFKEHVAQGQAAQQAWNRKLANYATQFPAEAARLQSQIAGELPSGWKEALPKNDQSIATRKASENSLAALLPLIPQLIGGSADLTGSNLTRPGSANLVDFQPASRAGRYLRFGVREHAMAGIMNGIDAHGGLLVYGATFLNFVGYALGSVRLSAMSHHHVVHVATHDSIGLGEDGPTHQPVELLATLRATPNLLTFRPSDQTETSGAWAAALEQNRSPSILCLSRQNTVPQSGSSFEGVARGAYTIVGVPAPHGQPQLILTASGSEVGLAVDAAAVLNGKGIRTAVVSFPCWALFDAQPESYKETVFPVGVPVVSVEPYSPLGWEKYSHYHIGMTTYGASAPASALYKRFNITVEHAVEAGEKLVNHFKGQAPDKRLQCRL